MSSSATTATTEANGNIKLCHIIKRPDFEGYGFNLHSEKSKPGQYIGKVDINSPAEAAGLREGERIIEVNGVNIGSEAHKQVVQRIKALGAEVRLLLADVTYDSAVATSATKQQIETESNESRAGGIVEEVPAASVNISSISMVSTKRASSITDNNSNNNNGGAPAISTETTNITTNAATTTSTARPNGNGNATSKDYVKDQQALGSYEMQSNATSTPLPPSVINAMAPSKQQQPTTIPQQQQQSVSNSSNNGGLQLPITAAEMRAKLLAKKKYDPKNEAVDLKRKFEIIQKL